ncbi:MAG: aa3-type cytochrome c oxidase subunit IV [Bradyrhizobium sp.]|uniref:aa3-type cytochrome c oxidase subunit IV n=1 Tax=Bradyrhizobium sp. TaxID=376 RepID=UPI001C281CEE|nr:aa3-type cytochrome c oxidase subunit IV [Bradyrhizobium sp.]MBU6463534.1 aa3-type cytochrome c oxidase subunit IV [Pseudomonadota bacterium]MDE2068755.1 aa3-type cytochrome c oxidase subunit IV [Bradyrhizobium sp.]MDE2244442.1 aa3-type cytochrome c oxidase subunit IV [Bradyrhizobium sp.]MDE2472425.1 aa3-type cytochrome c oxidase subunit IV [Bradyrhizobium sp.]
MADHSDHGEITYTIADGNDYQAHEHTYESFTKLVKIATAAVAFILIMMAIFLT